MPRVLQQILGKRPMPRSVFITGQLGIGKWLLVTNFWLWITSAANRENPDWNRYSLRRRLGERNMVIWYYETGGYLFAADGVLKVPSNHRIADFKMKAWALAGLDDYHPKFSLYTTLNSF